VGIVRIDSSLAIEDRPNFPFHRPDPGVFFWFAGGRCRPSFPYLITISPPFKSEIGQHCFERNVLFFFQFCGGSKILQNSFLPFAYPCSSYSSAAPPTERPSALLFIVFFFTENRRLPVVIRIFPPGDHFLRSMLPFIPHFLFRIVHMIPSFSLLVFFFSRCGIIHAIEGPVPVMLFPKQKGTTFPFLRPCPFFSSLF